MHRLGFVHRDLKPDNIMIRLNPMDVRIIDFERMRAFEDESKAMALGTPGYFPTSKDWKQGDRSWDIYALGAIICECDMPLDEYYKV